MEYYSRRCKSEDSSWKLKELRLRTCGNISNRVDSTRIETTLSIKGRNNSHEKDNRAVSMTHHMLSNISMDVDMS
ncbi:hypothetical protein FJT64_006917 [Amphibalanus amphitrite]|uniref:Uncharacterized protein n=1 Tax=Amphibalanus amphitrite TaxID=1232801 RepID=A0A6A4VN53_AMPAM|nr:hypothetical protein FJT64_006917 [Amphibalanus amphitrite]